MSDAPGPLQTTDLEQLFSDQAVARPLRERLRLQSARLTPYVVFLHGVPTNRRQWWPIQQRVARYVPTMSFDMLGMGESDHPRHYAGWEWQHDTVYIKQLFDTVIPTGRNIIFVADDWGGGILSSYITQKKLDPRIIGAIFLDPIAFDGYPVSEIQAIGRASAIKDDSMFQMAMGAFDQTLVQIY